MTYQRPVVHRLPVLLLLTFGLALANAQQLPRHGGAQDDVYPCVSAPLPTAPVGEFMHDHFMLGGEGFEMQAWRYPCDADRSVPMLTIIPDPGASPLLCSHDSLMVQGGFQGRRFRLVQDPMDPDEAFCSQIVVPTTLAVLGTRMGMGGHRFDFDHEFSFRFGGDFQHQMRFPPYDAEPYGVGSMGHAILSHRGLSGVWYEAGSQGQGFSLQMTPGGMILFFYGYAAGGSPLWLVSSLEPAPLAYGDTLTMTMYRGAGGVFGAPLPDVDPWGEVDITFEGCDSARAILDGEDGLIEMELTKLAGIDALRCY